MRNAAVLAAALIALAPACAGAQPMMPNPPDIAVDAATRAEVLDRSSAVLERSYIFDDVAKRATAALRAKLAAGEYDRLDGAKAFAAAVTRDLQEVTHDKHLRLLYSHEPVRDRPPPDAAEDRADPRRDAFLRTINHGFERAERLDGNIGYLEVRSFVSGAAAAEATIAGAMAFLADTDALIVDVRRNGGGDPETVALLSSYLFDQRTHLNDLYWRERGRTDEFWTRDEVKGRRYGQQKPVYVLTSARTFSGAEEFANNLKALKRATIVGETTGGGAHPGGTQRVGEHFALWVPTGRAINPVTKTNWEGTGVVPDVAVPADEALEKAKALAREALKR